MKHLILFVFILIIACGIPNAAKETVYVSKSPMIIKTKTKVNGLRGKYKYDVKDAGYGFILFTHAEYEVDDTLYICRPGEVKQR
jgi:hypothetical protein